MPLRKKVGYTGLKDLSYSIRDNDAISRDYFNIVEFPNRFTAGKNLFKIKAQANTLVDQSEIYIEILDFNGDPIYYEPINYVEKDGTRVIAVYIYPDTSPGAATVYIAGRARINANTSESIPYSRNINDDNYFKIPNVLWQRIVTVAPAARNNTEIIFTQYPKITITEVIQPYLQPVDIFNVFTTVSASAGASLTITPIPINNPGDELAAPNTFEGGNTPGTPNFGNQFFDIGGLQNSLNISNGTSAEAPPLYTLSGASKLTTVNFPLSASMIGGILEIVNPNITTAGTADNNGNAPTFKTLGGNVYPASQGSDFGVLYGLVTANTITPLSGSYKFAITQVINSTQARVAQYSGFRNDDDNTYGPFSVKLVMQDGNSNNIKTINSSTNFTASFTQPLVTIQTERSSSFADLILSNIEPATGDVFKIKTLYKPTGFFGDFIDLGDTILEQVNLLIDTNSLEQDIAVGVAYENFGVFENLTEITTYWSGSSVGMMPTDPFTLAYDTETLIGGARLNVDYATTVGTQYVASATDGAVFQIKPQYRPEVTAGTEYIIRFSIANDPDIELYSSSDDNLPNARLDVYISGSQLQTQEQFRNASAGNIIPVPNFNATTVGDFRDNGPLGTRVGTYQTRILAGTVANIEFRFVATQTKTVDLKFVTRNGSFILGNIQLLANKETGFSPNYTRIFKRIPTEHLNTPLTFKFQYYDYESKLADLVSIVYGVIFDGDNIVIEGDNNLLTGSLFISNTVGSGIEMAGANSGYVRSVGYTGFSSASIPALNGQSGWMIWSGSVLPESGDSYTGVGLELVADEDNYFQYRSSPSSLIVKTSKFFFGGSGQYISGSNGNIEISSSKFHLRADGTVTGSDVKLQRRVGTTNYVFLDTNVGFADFSNIGRQVVSDNGEYTRTGDDGVNFGPMTPSPEWIFNVLPYETDLIVSYNQKATANGTTGTSDSRVRFYLYYIDDANSGSLNTADAYDVWIRDDTSVETGTQLIITNGGVASQWAFPASTITQHETLDISGTKYQGKVVKLVMSASSDANTDATSVTTFVKNISVYTTRAYASAVADPNNPQR